MPNVQSTPETDRPFVPFSILTSAMTDLSADDPAYNMLRKSFITHAYENGAYLSGIMGGHQYTAGRALKSLIKFATMLGDSSPSPNIIAEAQAKGIEIYPGRGVSFVDPEKIALAASPYNKDRDIVHVDNRFIDFAHAIAAPRTVNG